MLLGKRAAIQLPAKPILRQHQSEYKLEFCQQHAVRVRKCITSMMCYTVQIELLFFLCTLGVNVNISTSINDVGVQCDLISLPLLTSTPTQCIESEEEDDIILPQDHGEDNLSQSWGDITEDPSEADCISTRTAADHKHIGELMGRNIIKLHFLSSRRVDIQCGQLKLTPPSVSYLHAVHNTCL